MKLNYRPDRVAFIDFETQSTDDLDTVRKYAAHSSTTVLSCVVKTEATGIIRMGPYLSEEHRELLHTIAQDHVLVAHNAPFDAAIWEQVLKLPEATWFDTLPCCRAAGLPGGLDDVGKALFGRGKDKNGGRLIDLLCRLPKNGKVPAVGPAHKLLIDYNERDVELMEQVYEKVAQFAEPDVMQVDRVINERGVPIHRQLAQAISNMYKTNAEKHEEEYSELTGGVNPRSSKQVISWLEEKGFAPKSNGKSSTAKPAMNALLERPNEFFVGDDDTDVAAAFDVVREAVEVRREVSGVGGGKIANAIAALDADDRLRDMFVYYKGHTGRWAGRKLQLHNMPSQMYGLDARYIEPTYEAVVEVAKQLEARLLAESGIAQRVSIAQVLSMFLRTLVRSDNLIVADYSGVEARCLAWMAGCEKQLVRYRDPHGKSVYLDMADHVFQRSVSKKNDPSEYNLAKSLVLGCGYGMSGGKFEYTMNMRESRKTLKVLADAGIDLKAAVKTYRTTYPEIPLLWRQANDAIHATVGRGEESYVARCTLVMSGSDMHMVLPSDRIMVYRNAHIEMVVPSYCKMLGMPEVPIPTMAFDKPNSGKGFVYGSLLVENISQAVCRDIMAEALVSCEQEHLDPILHVHDEIACEKDESSFDQMLQIMSTPPTWAPDFPVLVEGYSGPIWSKVTDGYTQRNAFNGKIL